MIDVHGHKIKLKSGGDVIVSLLSQGKDWEDLSLLLWKDLHENLGEDNVTILDIGSYNGIYSLLSHKINPENEIIAFEPMVEHYYTIKENIKSNGCNSIEVFNLACSNKSGENVIYKLKDSLMPSNSTLVKPKEYHEEISINTVIVDEVSFAYPIKLVKIDVERHENEVIEGMKKTIESDKPSILIEFLDDDKLEKQLEYFRSVGYKSFIQIDDINKNTIEVTDDTKIRHGATNFLFKYEAF